MSAALFRLWVLQLRGRVVRFARQLRQPKYLVGLVIGVGWIGFWSTNWLWRSDGPGISGLQIQQRLFTDSAPFLQLAVASGVALWFSVAWLVPWGGLGLALKQSELHVLLPAPVSRRRLIQYSLLRAQGPLLATAAIFTLLLGSGGTSRLRLFVAIWFFFTIWELHTRYRAMVLLRLRELPPGRARMFHALIVVAVVLFWALLLPRLAAIGRAAFNTLQAEGSVALLRDVLAPVAETLDQLWLRPLVWVTAPAFAGDWTSFGLALIPAALLVLLLHEGIVRSRARFEEPAMEYAAREESKTAPGRRYRRLSASARRRVPVPLAAHGAPEVAVVWKNVVHKLRWPLRDLLGIGALLVIAIVVLLAALGAPGFVFNLLGGIGAWGVLFGPWIASLGFRNDIRTELQHLDVVRTWPVAPTRFVLAQAVAPAVLGTLIAVGGMLVIGAAHIGGRLAEAYHGGTTSRIRVSFVGAFDVAGSSWPWLLCVGVGLLPLVAGFTLLISTLQNLAALLFPAWMGSGAQSGRGMAAMGQNLLVAMALGFCLLIALLPGALLLAAVVALQWWLNVPWTPWIAPLWGLIAATPLFVEVWLVTAVGGRVWARLDPATEILEAT